MHVALIGIGPGLGMALARRFARAGTSMSLVARSPETVCEFADVLRSEGKDATGFAADAGDELCAAETIAAMRERYGEIDTLIYNVAALRPDRFVTPSGVEQLSYGIGWRTRGRPASVGEFMESLRSNVVGALIWAQHVAPSMCERRVGTILFTGGALGLTPWIEWASVSAGKAAFRSLAKSIHKELRPCNVHAALVTIHSHLIPGTVYDPAHVAELFNNIARQPAQDWLDEYHFCPDGKTVADPDGSLALRPV